MGTKKTIISWSVLWQFSGFCILFLIYSTTSKWHGLCTHVLTLNQIFLQVKILIWLPNSRNVTNDTNTYRILAWLILNIVPPYLVLIWPSYIIGQRSSIALFKNKYFKQKNKNINSFISLKCSDTTTYDFVVWLTLSNKGLRILVIIVEGGSQDRDIYFQAKEDLFKNSTKS